MLEKIDKIMRKICSCVIQTLFILSQDILNRILFSVANYPFNLKTNLIFCKKKNITKNYKNTSGQKLVFNPVKDHGQCLIKFLIFFGKIALVFASRTG